MNLIQWLLNDYGFLNTLTISSIVILVFSLCVIFEGASITSVIFAGIIGYILIVNLGPSIETSNKYGSTTQKQNLHRCIKFYQEKHPYLTIDDNNIEAVTAFCNINLRW
ncbi:Uncharacterised protein [Neisseria animaloris]|uniref:hypothetical protein n=1 Tax=Neisseria animaloris TaxID=326522 RepID=UPI000F6F36E9|nr:hypothetical protein [Neisseria animaloris]VEH87784.1 Uncharacterised protein [Neisseria animaloris]